MNKLDNACESFRRLLEEQLARIDGIESETTDYSKKETVTIGLIDGDGIGPVIMEQAKREAENL